MKKTSNNQHSTLNTGRPVRMVPSAPGVECSALNVSPAVTHSSRSGVALVITLIMLSVTLIMAVAFLAVARRERNAVTTTTDTTTARIAAESALAAAQAQIAANIFSSTNVGAYNFHLLVSTNYINSLGFTAGSASPTNVNYDYYLNGSTNFTTDDRNQNIANLLFLPRAPVVVGSNDFRFYLDLNRNGVFETNNWAVGPNNFGPGDPEWIGVLEHPDQPHGPNNQFIARYAFLAQPIGNSLDLNAIHNQVLDEFNANSTVNGRITDGFFRNQGVGSWEINLAAFLADLNTNMWGQVIGDSGNGNINYYYYLYPSGGNRGVAFYDAQDLLAYRYANNYSSLARANQLFFNAGLVFPNDNIDLYSDGPLQTTTTNINESLSVAGSDGDKNTATISWAGADNTNHFYSLSSDLFNVPAGFAPGFTTHLQAIGQTYNPNSVDFTNYYNRYTFYRMLDQLGTESVPESGKLNLNYSNAVVEYDYSGSVAVVTNIAIVPGAETNLVSWAATNFFNAAADRMLRVYTTNWFTTDPTNFYRTYYGTNPPGYLDASGVGVTNLQYFGQTNQIPAFGVGNIPVRMNGSFVYTPAVNRLLQFAANLYDASTNSFYPSVFRPIFEHDGDGNVFIVGYRGVSSISNPLSDPQLALPYEVSALPNLSANFTPITDGNGIVNVYGVPWIIGAKKNFPALNQFSMVNAAQFTRKLQVERKFVGGPIATNQLVVMSVSNNMGISFWNSYSNNYVGNYSGPLKLSIVVNQAVRLVVTNSDWGTTTASYLFTTNYVINPTIWPGSKWGNNGSGSPLANSFIATNWSNLVVPDSAYNFTTKTFNQLAITPDPWDVNRTILDPLPQFGLLTTNWVQAYIVDGNNVIDYVQLRGPIDGDNINNALNEPDLGPQAIWATNIWGSGTTPSWGIVHQLDISKTGQNMPIAANWKKPPNFPPGLPDSGPPDEAQFFSGMFVPDSKFTIAGTTYTNFALSVQAPYTAMRTVYVSYLYQVNDPLVHYTVNDLDAGTGVWQGKNEVANGVWHSDNGVNAAPFPIAPTASLGRYQPWGRPAPNAFMAAGTKGYNFGNPKNLIYKDPLIWGSDYWDFPTNQYPTIGWIGRVHRGTPWQTTYLKAQNVLHASTGASGTNTWSAWTGDYNNFDAANDAPIRDRLLFDLFTAAPNDNASHGQLSVNQTHLAAWSAMFSGMVALSNNISNAKLTVLPPPTAPFIINPAGVSGLNSALGYLVTNINNQRAVFTNADGVVGAFEHKGDILSTLALTEQSPFLNLTGVQSTNGITDEVYEWLPQQMMSLLTCPTGPRYVVYCYGQTLRPAPNSVVTSSSALPSGLNPFGMVTNYQVTAENAVRAVIRFEKHVTATGTNYSTVVESYNVLGPN